MRATCEALTITFTPSRIGAATSAAVLDGLTPVHRLVAILLMRLPLLMMILHADTLSAAARCVVVAARHEAGEGG